MYPRAAYVTLLTLAVAALQFAASFGDPWQVYLAYVIAVGFGVVVFYQGERAVTAGPAFVNAGMALLVGTFVSHLASTGLVIYLLGAPWDLALWQMAALMWDSWFGIGAAFVSAFFVVAVGSSVS